MRDSLISVLIIISLHDGVADSNYGYFTRDTSPTRQFAYLSELSPGGFFTYGNRNNSHLAMLMVTISIYCIYIFPD